MLLVEQIKAARMLLGWDQATLAKNSGLGIGTIKRLESKTGTIGGTVASLVRIQTAFEKAGIEFIGGPGEGPGVRFWKKVR